MALPRKRSRLIAVDGVIYRWRVRHRLTYCQGNGWTPFIFAAEHAEARGCVLVVSLPAAHPGNWMGLPSMVIKPVTAAAIIRMALGQGWQPAARGTAFRLSLPGGELPDRNDLLH